MSVSAYEFHSCMCLVCGIATIEIKLDALNKIAISKIIWLMKRFIVDLHNFFLTLVIDFF
jgi:hypothetical protein